MIERQNIIGRIIGTIAGNDNPISLTKKIKGKPLLIDKSISWTLLLSEKIDKIRRNNKKQLAANCLRKYFSINFIDIFSL